MEMTKLILNKKILVIIFVMSFFSGISQNIDYSYLKAKSEFYYKNYNKALKNINNAIGIDKNNYRNYLLRGKIYLKQTKFDFAIKDFTKSNKLKQNSSNFYKAKAYCQIKDWENTNKYL
ncbi:MAG: hypothetical protein DRI94_10920, partial [Bacteroidetes bacterium]